MLNRIFLSALLVFSHCTPAFAQSMKFSRPDIVESQDSKVNYVINPSGFKNALNVTTSSATIAQDVTGSSDLLDGVASLVCDASAQNGYCEWDSKTIQEGDKTGNCEAKAVFKGDASLYKLQIHDGSNVVTSSAVLANASDWSAVSVNYPCGTTRTVRLTQTESGTGAAVNIGRVYWGQATNLGVANQIGPWESYTCTGSWVANTTYNCKYRRVGDSIELEINLAITGTPTSANLSVNLPTGLAIDSTKISTVATLGPAAIVSAGSGTVGYVRAVPASSTTAIFVMTNAGLAVTQAAPGTFTNNDAIRLTTNPLPIVGWGAQAVVNDNNTPWYVDAKITGANISLGTSIRTSYIDIADASLTLTPSSGSAAVGITCDSTNAAASPSTSASTCSAGSEDIGFNTAIPWAGTYNVCFSFSHYTRTDGDVEAIPVFQTYETPTNAQTLTTAGGSAITSGAKGNTGGTNMDNYYPNKVCGVFNFSSAGTKAIRLMYVQQINGTPDSNLILADGAGSASGGRNIHVSMYPFTAASPMPLLVGSVTSNSTGLERIERVNAVSAGGSCTISSQSGTWVSSTTHNNNGDCSLNLNTAIFGTSPACNCTVDNGSSQTVACMFASSPSSSLIRFQTRDKTDALIAGSVNIICMGPRGN
jgi:hypothetical protein